MPDIYLSYDPEDLAAAEAIATAFEARERDVYLESRATVDDPDPETALYRAGCVVALWSEAALGNELVIEEAGVGSARSALVNALVADVRPPRRFKRSATADVVDWDRTNSTDPGLIDLVNAVDEALARSAERSGAPFDPYLDEAAAAEEETTPAPTNVFSGSPVDFAGHDGEIYDLAVSLDGALLATASEDGTAGIWDVAGAALLYRIEHRDEVNDVAFHPRESVVATASADGTVAMWDLANGARIRRAEHGSGEVFWVGFSPDGKLLATAGEDARVVVWQPDRLEVVWELSHHEAVPTARFLPDGTVLAVASDDGNVTLWDLESGDVLHVLDAHDEPIADMAFSPDGRQLATGSTDGKLSVWNLGDISLTWWSGEITGAVYGVAFAPDGRLLAESDDAGVSVWTAADGDLVDFYTDENATRLEFSPAGGFLAWASGATARVIGIAY